MGRIALALRGEGRWRSIAKSWASWNPIQKIVESPEFHDLPFAELPLAKPCNILISTRSFLWSLQFTRQKSEFERSGKEI